MSIAGSSLTRTQNPSVIKRLLFLLVFLAAGAGLASAQTVRPMVGQLEGDISKAGEDLFAIAFRHRLAVDHLAFANGFPITTLRVKEGTRVLIPTWRV